VSESRSAQFEVVWHRPTDSQVAARGIGAALEVIMELPDLFDFDFRVGAGAQEPFVASFIVGGVDVDHAESVAVQVRSVLSGYVPWMGLGEVTVHDHAAELSGSSIYDLVEVSGPGRRTTHEFAPCWSVAAAQSTRTTMRIRVSRMNLQGVDEPTFTCAVSMSGDGGGLATVAAAMAGELAGSTRYATRLRRHGSAGVSLDLPIDIAGRLLSTPARIREGWPAHRVVSSQSIMSVFTDSTPPHSAVFGGSGLGKTTFLEHRIQAQIERGDQVVVLCPHGDLPRRAGQIFNAAGAPFDAVDFGHSEVPPRCDDRTGCPWRDGIVGPLK
jgi:carbon monoxide dehydrogenase subunit G